MQQITLRRPIDAHLHLRDGAALHAVIGDTACRFAKAIVMPNLKPPVATVAQALSYRERIMSAYAHSSTQAPFEPLMTLYMTPQTSVDDISQAHACDHIVGVKFYPAGATTHSEAGVHDLFSKAAVLERMEELDVPLLVHGEVTDPAVDVFDREARFIESQLQPLVQRFPNLRVVFEHITTKDAAEFVSAAGHKVAATLTPQHLLVNRNALFEGGLRVHHYCLPVLKREVHRLALVEAIKSGSPQFFLGTDSAPHGQKTKEAACGCAGIYSAHAGIELYAECFDGAECLPHLEAFASLNAARFYGFEPATETITLEKSAWTVPAALPFGDDQLIPFRASGTIAWRIVA